MICITNVKKDGTAKRVAQVTTVPLRSTIKFSALTAISAIKETKSHYSAARKESRKRYPV